MGVENYFGSVPTPPIPSSLSTSSSLPGFSDSSEKSITLKESEIDSLLAGLNPPQQQAVLHGNSPLLVVAGAGSGKTRVLTHRIAHLIRSGKARASEILAITFTNKAAREMRERLVDLLGVPSRALWAMTFHSACVRILRTEHEAAGLRSTFSIYDTADRERLLKSVIQELNYDIKQFSPSRVGNFISQCKNELFTVEALQAGQVQVSGYADPRLVEIYELYEHRLKLANALDFDSLISRTVELIKDNEQLRNYYQKRFKYVLVDEYQDTNHAQYQLIRQLVGSEGQGLTVVGDSDQSIYAFRGATIRNIEEFEQDFPQAQIVLLEQNYRSTQNILSAANAIIACNPYRRTKNLWTDSGAGSPITVHVADNAYDEARYVVRTIEQLRSQRSSRTSQPYNYCDTAVFYRTNAQSRALEEGFLRAGIPYVVVGGTKFYERKEIKDALAYLRAAVNPDDAISLRRILNVPRRGLGAKSEEILLNHAAQYEISFGQAIADYTAANPNESRPLLGGLSAKARTALQGFQQVLEQMRNLEANDASISEIIDVALEASGYADELRKSTDVQDAVRLENIAEIRSVALDAKDDEGQPLRLAAFLEQVALVSDLDTVPDGTGQANSTQNVLNQSKSFEQVNSNASQVEAGKPVQNAVTLMTVHTAKGLEFANVFVTGLEDGTFPHQRSLENEEEIFEERRLAYVALTRAQENLFLTRSATRNSWGGPQELPPSRFFDELPAELLKWDRRESFSQRMRSRLGSNREITENSFALFDEFSDDQRLSFAGLDDDFAPPIGQGREPELALRRQRSHSKKPERLDGSVSKDSKSRSLDIGTKDEEKNSTSKIPEDTNDLEIGEIVKHAIYGRGIIIDFEGVGRGRVACVRFREGVKRILVRLNKLEPWN